MASEKLTLQKLWDRREGLDQLVGTRTTPGGVEYTSTIVLGYKTGRPKGLLIQSVRRGRGRGLSRGT